VTSLGLWSIGHEPINSAAACLPQNEHHDICLRNLLLDIRHRQCDTPAVLAASQVERLSKLIEAPAEELGTEGPVTGNTTASG
jgi:hypothetical protein